MEAIKRNLTLDRPKSHAVAYVTKQDEFNLNENLEDIDSIIQEKGEVRILEVKAEENKIKLLGEIVFSCMYLSASLEKHLASYAGRISFEEEMNMEGLCETDDLQVNAGLAELQAEIVNSRKLRIHGVIELNASVTEFYEEEIMEDAKDEQGNIQTKKGEIVFLNRMAHKKENCKIKEELQLQSGQENIERLIWYVVDPANIELKLLEGQISFSGDLNVFALYQGESGSQMENVQAIVPFQQSIACGDCHEGQILNGNIHMLSAEIEVKPDYDGEERSLHITCMAEVNIDLYTEEAAEILEDVYSVGETIRPVSSLLTYQKLLLQNASKCRINENLHMKGMAIMPLQLLYSQGRLKNLQYQQNDGGVSIEGELEVMILYITSDDEHPYASYKGSVPVQHFVEIPRMTDQSEYQVDCRLDQLSVSLAGNGELEVKALALAQIFAYDMILCPVIKDVEKGEEDMERLQNIAGITGYIVKEDDTLWNIAKEYSTTIDKIKEINGLKSDQLKVGDPLVIVKSVGESLSFV